MSGISRASKTQLVIGEIAYELQDLRLQPAELGCQPQTGMLAHSHSEFFGTALELHADSEEPVGYAIQVEARLPLFNQTHFFCTQHTSVQTDDLGAGLMTAVQYTPWKGFPLLVRQRHFDIPVQDQDWLDPASACMGVNKHDLNVQVCLCALVLLVYI